MKCVLVDSYASGNRDRLAALLQTPWEIATAALEDSDDTLEEALYSAEAVVSQGWSLRLAGHAAGLRLLQLPNAGADAVDWRAVPEGCVVCNAYEHEAPVAEFAILAIMESAIGLRELDASLRANDWSLSHRTFGPRHREVAGATVGIIGYGRIGRAIADRAIGLGMVVMAVSRRVPQDERLVAAGDMTALGEMLARADYVVVACPLTEETRGLIGAAELERMPRSACLINVGRADIIDERALYESLRDGAIRHAVIDVWWRYPEPGSSSAPPSAMPFAELPNVTMSPHVAGWTDEMLTRRWAVVAGNLDRLARGEDLVNRVARP